jgi:hypothetical protein
MEVVSIYIETELMSISLFEFPENHVWLFAKVFHNGKKEVNSHGHGRHVGLRGQARLSDFCRGQHARNLCPRDFSSPT